MVSTPAAEVADVTGADGKVIWHATVSVDGYIAGPEHSVNWLMEYFDPSNTDAAQIGDRTGVIVVGRNSWDVGQRDNRGFFNEQFQGPLYLLTHRELPERNDLEQGSVNIRYGEVWPVITEAMQAGGGRDLLIIGADVARQVVEENLVDELVLHIAPLLLGQGVRLFDADVARRLELLDSHSTGGVITARYQVHKDEERKLVHGRI